MARHRADMARYRQIRFTVSEQWPGRLDYRIMVKPLNAPWQWNQTVRVGSVDAPSDTDTLDGVLAALVAVLQAERAPADLP